MLCSIACELKPRPKLAPLVLFWFTVSSISLYFTVITAFATNSYKPQARIENNVSAVQIRHWSFWLSAGFLGNFAAIIEAKRLIIGIFSVN